MVNGLKWLIVSKEYGSREAQESLIQADSFLTTTERERAEAEQLANTLLAELPPPETEQMKQIADLMRSALGIQ